MAKNCRYNGVIRIPLSVGVVVVVPTTIVSVSVLTLLFLITTNAATDVVMDDTNYRIQQSTDVKMPNDLPSPYDQYDHFCSVNADTSTRQQQQQPHQPLSSLWKSVIIYIDDITLRILLPTYLIIIVVYIILLLLHPYIASKKKVYIHYHRILSSLLAFVLPGIRIIPLPDDSSTDVFDDDNNNLLIEMNNKDVDDNTSQLDVLRNVQQQQSDEVEQPIDMSGSYQMTYHENLDAFLAVQGVPWPLRRAASAVLPIHHIVHRGNHLSIQIVAQSSGFTTQTQYIIHGPPVETNVRGRIFEDRVYYSYEDGVDDDENDENILMNTEIVNTDTNSQSETNVQNSDEFPNGKPKRQCNGMITEKRAVTEGYIVTVCRKLVTITDLNRNNDSRNGNNGAPSTNSTAVVPLQQIHMTSTVSFPNEPNKENVVCIQMFDRIK